MNSRQNAICFAVLSCIGFSSVHAEEPLPVGEPEPRHYHRDPAPNCGNAKTPVKLASSEIAEAIGLEFIQLAPAPLERIIERNAEVHYNANRYAHLSSRVGGVILGVAKDLGEPVRKGDVLVAVESSELGAVKADLMQARETANLWQANADRERALVEKGVGVERDALEAETRSTESRIGLNKARQRLRNLGLTPEQVRAVEDDGEGSSVLEVRAPFDGVIVERHAVLGELVDSGKPLLAVSDTSVMWARVDLLEADLAIVKVGQQAAVRLDGLPGKTFSGPITWISTQLNEKTRAVEGRIELQNPDGLLRAHMFGSAAISTSKSAGALTVPKGAVQWEGCCNVAFVKTDDKGLAFQPARLTLGFDAGDRYEVLSGLSAGDVVVTRGSFILKNELMKGAIGAGCCEVGHLKE